MLRTIIILMGLALLGITAWAIPAGDLLADLEQVWAIPWGRQVLVDLYLGFLIAAVVIFLHEPDKRVALLWAVPVFFLGNIVTFVWFALRYRPLQA